MIDHVLLLSPHLLSMLVIGFQSSHQRALGLRMLDRIFLQYWLGARLFSEGPCG